MPVKAHPSHSSTDQRRQNRGQALYDEIKAAILEGVYAPGSRMLSTRACAAERGLSRSTVSTVYENLAAQGYIETTSGAASRVAFGAAPKLSGLKLHLTQKNAPLLRSHTTHPVRLSAVGDRIAALLPQANATHVTHVASGQAASGLIDFAYGPISGRDFPTLAWRKAARQVELNRPALVGYTDSCGEYSFRLALQSYLSRSRGIQCDIEQIIVVNGSQQALDICARLLLNPKDQVVVENPGYRLAHQAFEVIGTQLCGIDVDDQGLRTDQLNQYKSARMAYVTPSHQYPLGAFLSVARRQQLLAWANTNQAWVIEDDYDSEYRYSVRPDSTLKSSDPYGRVIYIGTFSKTLSPQLRLGYAIVPHCLSTIFSKAKELIDRHTAVATQQTLGILLNNGIYDRHVRRIRRIQHAKCNILIAELQRYFGEHVNVQGAAGGLHVVVWFQAIPRRAEKQLCDLAYKAGLLVYSIDRMYIGTMKKPHHTHCAGLVMGYASLDGKQIVQGIKKLRTALRPLISD
jgi:GntR family transcriptional regulator / MocR family aminotransferase